MQSQGYQKQNEENIALTGLMGSGKSSVGRTLARVLKRKFIDTDYIIEKESGMTIAEIFEKKGEAHFRSLEKKLIKKVVREKGVIISLGGGAIVDDENRKTIKDNCKLVVLLAEPDELVRRIKRRAHRPLLDKGDNETKVLEELWADRKDAYLDSHVQVKTSEREVDEIAEDVLKALKLSKVTKYQMKVHIPREAARYNIHFRKHSQLNLSELNIGDQVLIVTQEPVAKHYLDSIKETLSKQFKVHALKIEDGEDAKNLFTYQLILQKCLSLKLERKDTLIALGGGVVGDLTGFAAATYMRGIKYVQVPTSLLAMLDSSVGGKTGINTPEGKNLVGSFYQPSMVHIDSSMLKTLSDQEYKSGLGELVKYAVLGSRWDVMLGESFFSFLGRNTDKILKRDEDILRDSIEHCLKIKASIVSQDEKEKGIRAHLNLGHTFAHAIEEITDYKRFSHGEAVAKGLVCACILAQKMNLIKAHDTEKVENLLKALDIDYFIPNEISTDEMLEAFKYDKKVEDHKIRFILPKGKVGKVDIYSNIDMNQVRAAINHNRRD